MTKAKDVTSSEANQGGEEQAKRFDMASTPADPALAQAAQADPNEAERITEAQMAAVTSETAKALRQQPKRAIRLYQNPEGQPQLPDEYVSLNGHSYLIKRGLRVEVPEEIANILEEAGRL